MDPTTVDTGELTMDQYILQAMNEPEGAVLMRVLLARHLCTSEAPSEPLRRLLARFGPAGKEICCSRAADIRAEGRAEAVGQLLAARFGHTPAELPPLSAEEAVTWIRSALAAEQPDAVSGATVSWPHDHDERRDERSYVEIVSDLDNLRRFFAELAEEEAGEYELDPQCVIQILRHTRQSVAEVQRFLTELGPWGIGVFERSIAHLRAEGRADVLVHLLMLRLRVVPVDIVERLTTATADQSAAWITQSLAPNVLDAIRA